MNYNETIGKGSQAILDDDKKAHHDRDAYELDKLLPTTSTITDIYGNIVDVPIVSWKREIQIIRALGSFLKAIPPEVFRVDLNRKEKRIPGAATEKFVEKLPVVLSAIATEDKLKDLTDIAAKILNKESEWVEDHLASPQIVELIVPFLLKRLTEITQKIPDATKLELGDLALRAQALA